MPKVGHVVQFQWLPVDNVTILEEETKKFGDGIAVVQNGHFSGWITKEDRPYISDEMWAYKWRVSEIYSEFYFHRGGGDARRAYIIPTMEPDNVEDDVSGELVESLKVVNGMIIRGVVVKQEAIEDPLDHQVKPEDDQGAPVLMEVAAVKEEVTEEVEHKVEVPTIEIKAEEIEDIEEQAAAEDTSDKCEGKERDGEESGDEDEANHKRPATPIREYYGGDGESDDQAASDDQESPNKRRRIGALRGW